MITREQIIEIGIFTKPHGVNGEISANVDCDIDLMKSFSCLICDIDGIFVPFFSKSTRIKSTQSILFTIDGINNEQEASLLVNKTIYVLKSEFDQQVEEQDSDELPVDYFIGFKVQWQKGELGIIKDIDDTTANVLFIVVDEDDNEMMIPAVDDFIVDINMDAKKIEMDIPEEIINL